MGQFSGREHGDKGETVIITGNITACLKADAKDAVEEENLVMQKGTQT